MASAHADPIPAEYLRAETSIRRELGGSRPQKLTILSGSDTVAAQ